jgi:elongation factor P
MHYLFHHGVRFVVMDTGTFEQTAVAHEIVGDASVFMVDYQEAIVATNEGRVLFIELPASVELVVSYTEPGVVGDSATGRTKPATLETGAEIQVPLFIEQGEKIKVDTREGGSYLSRVKG